MAVHDGPHHAAKHTRRAALVERRLHSDHVVQRACVGGRGSESETLGSRTGEPERRKIKFDRALIPLASGAQLLDHEQVVCRGVDAVQGHNVGVAVQ